MAQYKYLICVSAKNKQTGEEINNNKYYEMKENSDGTFTAEFGRIGSGHQTKIYDISKWESVYNSKINKVRNGYVYRDITDMRSKSTSKSFADMKDKEIMSFLNELQNYSKQSLIENYTVSSDQVTEAQVTEAQNILNQISKYMTKAKFDRKIIDDYLTELYHIIPRKMRNVKDFILNGSGDLKIAKEILKREQDSVDNMSQAVSVTSTQNSSDEEITLEKALGLKIEKIDAKDKETILKLMGKNSGQFRNAYRVINLNTQPKFDAQRKKSFKHWTKLLWHGSRNENWLSILKTGLLIRPSCAVYTGSMFGDGIYLANKCQKSVGYTSLRGSYWAGGSSQKGYLALFEVNTGMELRTKHRESWMSSLTEKKLKEKGDYDSLYAEGGADLINDEFVVYNNDRCTVKYIVEIN